MDKARPSTTCSRTGNRGAMRCAFSISGRAARAGGFTLLEVIAAILLLGVAFAALMKVASAAMALTQNAATHSAAAMWARSALDSAFATTPLRPGHSAGRFDRQFAWQLNVTPWSPPPRAGETPSTLALYQLDLTVSWQQRGRTNATHFRTLRLAPAGADGAERAP